MTNPIDDNFILSSRELRAIELDFLMEGSRTGIKEARILDKHDLSEASLPHHHPGLAQSIESLPEVLDPPTKGDEGRPEDWPDAPSRDI
ncbi:MAG: hypothetical protein LBV60_12245 [Streptomyces sp.]|jgi:hypothetical protein|nr:hypothetical protein [Streptomyces sp.]